MASSLASADTAYALTLGDKGSLSVAPSAGGGSVFSVSAAAGCLGPYRLVLQQTGNLAMIDRTNRSVWTSGSACHAPAAAATKACYSYLVSNQGQLMVQDQAHNVVWSSTGSGQAFGTARKSQLTSDSVPDLACIWSGPARAPSVLASPNGRFTASVDAAGRLQVVDGSSGAVLWTPPGVQPAAKAPAALCIRSTGWLLLLGNYGGWPAGLAMPRPIQPGPRCPAACWLPHGTPDPPPAPCAALQAATCSGRRATARRSAPPRGHSRSG
jgi:hypothetical protein